VPFFLIGQLVSPFVEKSKQKRHKVKGTIADLRLG
jgi:hypothetical protein